MGEDRAIKLMQAFFQLNRQRLHAVPVAGLRPPEVMTLRCIAKGSQGRGVMVSDLGRRLGVSAPAVTQTVNGLVRKGLVERAADPADRRAVRLRVTGAGAEALAAVHREIEAQFRGLVEYMGEEKSATLTALLSEVYTYFESRQGRDSNVKAP